MFKKHSSKKSSVIAPDTAPRHYWFTIVAANNQVLATSETYTTAAMRDKGIEAVKKVVGDILGVRVVNLPKSRKPSDTFHIENKAGKIVKR